MKISDNFDVREFVPPTIWRRYGKKSIWFVNKQNVIICEEIRKDLAKEYGEEVSIRVNNWHYGGGKTESGYRLPNTKTGSSYSQHKLKSGTDFEAILKKSGKEIPADDVRAVILKNEKKYLKLGLTTLEDGAYAPGWTHFDTRWTMLKHILIVKPN